MMLFAIATGKFELFRVMATGTVFCKKCDGAICSDQMIGVVPMDSGGYLILAEINFKTDRKAMDTGADSDSKAMDTAGACIENVIWSKRLGVSCYTYRCPHCNASVGFHVTAVAQKMLELVGKVIFPSTATTVQYAPSRIHDENEKDDHSDARAVWEKILCWLTWLGWDMESANAAAKYAAKQHHLEWIDKCLDEFVCQLQAQFQN